MKTILIAYVRTSDSSKEGDGRSETQLQNIEEYLGASVKPYHVFDDRMVGGTIHPTDREGFQDLLEFVVFKASDDTRFRVVAGDFSRFSRKMGVLPDLAEEMAEFGVSLESAEAGMAYGNPNTLPASEWMAHTIIHTVLPEFERRQITEKLQKGRKRKKAEGGYCGGGVPYGFILNDDGEMEEVLVEQVRLQHARNMLENGISIRNTASATTVPRGVIERLRKEIIQQEEQR